MNKEIDIYSGLIFGKWTVIEKVPDNKFGHETYTEKQFLDHIKKIYEYQNLGDR